MEHNAVVIDRDMAHVILKAFTVAEHEAMTSLVYSPGPYVEDGPDGRDYIRAELRVLTAIHFLYPDIANQYFDLNKQPKA